MKFTAIPPIDPDQWRARIPRRPGPEDPKRPPFRPQGTAPACTAFAIVGGMRSLLQRRGVDDDIDAGELFRRLPFDAGGAAPGTVFLEILTNGAGGWTIAGPLYDAAGKFDRAFSAALRRWPVVVCTRNPIEPGPDGYFRGWKPATFGHTMLAYKPGFLRGEPVLWCANSQWPAAIAIPQSALAGAAFYSFRQVKRLSPR